MKKYALGVMAVVGLLLAVGCVSVEAPREVKIGSDNRPPRQKIDSAHVPHTSSHEEARAELAKAYSEIRALERENDRLRKKYEDEKRKKNDCEKKLDRCKDKLERYEDD